MAITGWLSLQSERTNFRRAKRKQVPVSLMIGRLHVYSYLKRFLGGKLDEWRRVETEQGDLEPDQAQDQDFSATYTTEHFLSNIAHNHANAHCVPTALNTPRSLNSFSIQTRDAQDFPSVLPFPQCAGSPTCFLTPSGILTGNWYLT